MKKDFKLYFAISIALTLFLTWSCNDDDDITEITDPDLESIEIQDFIWGGLNLYYLWQPNVANLADDRFRSESEYIEFLSSEPTPEDFFESLLFQRGVIDRDSWIVDDYVELENSFVGISKSNGVDFGLARISDASNDLLGYVRYIMPNSDAAGKDIGRGDLFTEVNGTQLTIDNYRDLLFSDNDTYTLGLASVENGALVPNGRSVELTKFEYNENPILIRKTFEEGGKRIGYLLYNSFSGGYDIELNAAFADFKNEGVTDLILDLRYNGGGFGYVAEYLGSMVTGQFAGEIYSKDKWNPKIQAEFEAFDEELLIERFPDKLRNGDDIVSLNLNQVHVIVTGRSASASELIIAALKPYIGVTTIGTKTYGKYTGSVTLYDSENFTKENVNPNHFYAMQPIVLEYTNSVGENGGNGYDPDIERSENITDLGVLGDRNEPLLSTAINNITGVAAKFEDSKIPVFELISNSKLFTPMADRLIVDKPEFQQALKGLRDKNK